MKPLPSDEHNVSIESFFQTARQQIASRLDKSGMVNQVRIIPREHYARAALAVEKLVFRAIQLSAFCWTISPA